MDPIVVAILRAFVGGILVGASAGLATYTASGDTKTAGVAGGSAMITYWIARGGFEGVADQLRGPGHKPAPVPTPSPTPVAPPTPSPSPASDLAPGTTVRLGAGTPLPRAESRRK